jgi:hypothetical protein
MLQNRIPGIKCHLFLIDREDGQTDFLHVAHNM